MKNDRKITTYTCQKCKAVDHDNGFNDPAPANLNCYACHTPAAMVATSVDSPKGR